MKMELDVTFAMCALMLAICTAGARVIRVMQSMLQLAKYKVLGVSLWDTSWPSDAWSCSVVYRSIYVFCPRYHLASCGPWR